MLKFSFFVDGVIFNVPSGWLFGLLIRFFGFIMRLTVECTGSKHLGPFNCMKIWHVFNICCNHGEPIVKHCVPLCANVTCFEVQDQGMFSACFFLTHTHFVWIFSPIRVWTFCLTNIFKEHTPDNQMRAHCATCAVGTLSQTRDHVETVLSF